VAKMTSHCACTGTVQMRGHIYLLMLKPLISASLTLIGGNF